MILGVLVVMLVVQWAVVVVFVTVLVLNLALALVLVLNLALALVWRAPTAREGSGRGSGHPEALSRPPSDPPRAVE